MGYRLDRLKKNKKIFNALLQDQLSAQQNTTNLGILIGNSKAKNTLIKVCNPYCGPCAQVHSQIEELIYNNPDWNAQIIFTATGEEQDSRTAPTAHLMAIAAQNNKKMTQQALDDWYNAPKKDYNVFAQKYPMNGELQQQKEKLKAMDTWCKEARITHTPTFFVALTFPESERTRETMLYKLPHNYSIEDLIYVR
ncbi:hypothetical protein GCM10023143_18090 [Compostibacter hankyongensis]|uniref:Thioredoxin-like fold domain-containing protein n=1 Tax=Compostibacter hankyongensis TaxID=1007089 RepID=A0ABP8FS65_9BACT